jgi:putative oxidoreductase
MNPISSWAERAIALLKRLDTAALLVARLTVGVLFVSTGWGKVHNLEKVTSFFGELGIPMPALSATVASYTELVCGGLLVLGLASRFAALPLAVTMAVALLTAKRDDIHGLPDLFGLVEWTYVAILLVVTAFGPGLVSVDAWIARRLRIARSTAPSHGLSTPAPAYGRRADEALP